MFKRNRLLAAAVVAIVTMVVAASTYAFPTTNYNKLTFSGAISGWSRPTPAWRSWSPSRPTFPMR